MDYARIIEASLNEIYIFDTDTLRFIEVNRGARENIGYSLEELQQMTPLDIKPSYTLEMFDEVIAPLRSGEEEKIVFETQHLRKDCTLYPVEVHLQFTTLQMKPVFVAIILDISKQQKLSARNTELGKIFEKSLNEIFVFDVEILQFLEVNRGARENLGYSLEELQQMTPLDIKPSISPEEFDELIIPLRSMEKEYIVFETQHLRKNGTLYDVEIHLQLTTLEMNPVFVAIILDITERKKAEKQLFELTIENQRAQLIQSFISDTSHEFRTSLSILNTKTYLLKKGQLDDRGHKHLKVMQEHVNRLEQLVTSLQKSSVLESTEKITRSPLSINTIVKYIYEENSVIFDNQRLQVTLDLHTPEYVLYGDENLLKTAIYNIIKNAVDFNVEGGEIYIRTRIDGNFMCLVIRDTGIGITQDDLPHIFDHLYRVDDARSIVGGTGLGLTIAKRILALHGGHIKVESIMDQGSLFKLYIPLILDTNRV